MRPWLVFSSSSGGTFKGLWGRLSPEAKDNLKGFFTDRPCAAAHTCRQIAQQVPAYELSKPEFESTVLEWIEKKQLGQAVILLCGYFGILSPEFLKRCTCPIINTHPSLLPAFPGLDRSVHKEAAETVTVSGFSVHMVTEHLDGGPILFQHPVWLDPLLPVDEVRESVRQAEQRWLPRVVEKVLATQIQSSDRNLSGRELRKKYDLKIISFGEVRDG